jgi:hydroxymethylbilane synthase
MLARAGLIRLNLSLPDAEVLSGPEWLPALCQGIIGIETREGDGVMRAMVAEIDDAPTHLASACERGFLAALDGSCRTPIAGLASVEDGMVHFRGQVLTADGGNSWTVTRAFAHAELSQETALAQSYAAGEGAAHEIRRLAGRKLPRF